MLSTLNFQLDSLKTQKQILGNAFPTLFTWFLQKLWISKLKPISISFCNIQNQVSKYENNCAKEFGKSRFTTVIYTLHYISTRSKPIHTL